MSPSTMRRSAALAAFAALALAHPAAATDPGNAKGVIREGAQAALNGGIELMRRILNLQQDEIVSHAISVSNREATLELETAGGRSRSISLRGGRILVDGTEAGRYAGGGPLERSWRRLLADGAELETRAFLVSLRAWRITGLAGEDLAAKNRLDEAVRGAVAAPGQAKSADAAITIVQLDSMQQVESRTAIQLSDLEQLDDIQRQLSALDDLSPEVAEAVRSGEVHLGHLTVAAGQSHEGDLIVYRGTADIRGRVTGNVVALFGDVAYHEGAVIDKSAVSIGGHIVDRGGTVHGDIRTISEETLEHADQRAARAAAEPRSALDSVVHGARTVIAVFVAFAMLGFGTVFFGRRYLEVVADTARHSFGRSLVVGLLGQLLLLPTFAMLCVGLVFTVVGILLLPFAAAAYLIGAILAVVGGYLAIAHAVGETFTRRRMANGAFVRAPNAYGYLFTGLIGLLGLWAAAALTGWMGPVVVLFKVAAIIVTWLAATVGFGAVLLSRAGLREAFAGRHYGEMSDEYLWATPPATPTAARMKQER